MPVQPPPPFIFYFSHFYFTCLRAPLAKQLITHRKVVYCPPPAHRIGIFRGVFRPLHVFYLAFRTELSDLCISVPSVSLPLRRKDHFPRLIIVLSSMRMSTNPSMPCPTRRWASCFFPRHLLLFLQGHGADVLLAQSRSICTFFFFVHDLFKWLVLAIASYRSAYCNV